MFSPVISWSFQRLCNPFVRVSHIYYPIYFSAWLSLSWRFEGPCMRHEVCSVLYAVWGYPSSHFCEHKQQTTLFLVILTGLPRTKRVLFLFQQVENSQITGFGSDWLVLMLIGWLIDWLIDWLIEWVSEWVGEWVSEGMSEWSVGWLVG